MGFEKVEHLLPDTVLDIVDVIGLAATEQLVKAIGGARFKFGKGKVDTERLAILVEAIGEVKTHELLQVYGGEELYVPRCGKALIQLRNHRFYQEFVKLRDIDKESGLMAMTKLCPKYGIGASTNLVFSFKLVICLFYNNFYKIFLCILSVFICLFCALSVLLLYHNCTIKYLFRMVQNGYYNKTYKPVR